jgi:hypothetical protein
VGCASAGKGSRAYLLQAQIFEPRGRHGARPRGDGGGARLMRETSRATRPIRLETKSNTQSTARRRRASALFRVGGVRSAHATTPRCRTPCVRDRAPRRCARAPSSAPPEATPARMTAKHQRTHLFGTRSVSRCQNRPSRKRVEGKKKNCQPTVRGWMNFAKRVTFSYGPPV